MYFVHFPLLELVQSMLIVLCLDFNPDVIIFQWTAEIWECDQYCAN